MVAGGMAIASMIPILNCGCCFWMLAGGALAVVLYSKKFGPLGSGDGAKLGAITGLFGFGIYAVLNAGHLLILRMMGRTNAFRDQMQKAIEESMARNPNPDAQAMMERFMTDSGMVIIVVLSMVVMFFAFTAFSALGGIIGASVSKK